MSQQKPRKGIWEWIWNKEKDQPKDRERGKDDRVVNSNSNSKAEKPDSISLSATTTITSKLSAKATDISEDLTKARSIIADIEKIIQSEIDTVGDAALDSPSKSSQSNSNSKKKRPGPKLIRPLNKRKTRMVMGDMEFDPTQNIWIGNEKDLQAFKQPALITHMGNLSPKDYGDMVYDPELKIWRGNEKILRKFRSIRRPKLIGPTENMVSEIEHKGMHFDQETMTWRGNDEDILDFDGFEVSETERQFKVGNEFNLSAEMKESFRRSEEANKRQLRGWFKDRPGIDRHVHSHLSLIRNMSIMKIINLAKQAPQLSSSLDNVPPARTRSLSGGSDVTSSPIRAYAHRTISAPGTPKFSSDDDDWNDIELPKSPKLKLTISAPHLRVDDEDSDKSTERPKRANKSLLDKLQQFKDKEDINDDVDFSSFSPATLSNKVGSSSSLKVSDAEDSGISSEGERLDDDDDVESEEKDWEGLDVPSTPLALRKFSDASDANFSEGEKEVDSKPRTPLTKSGDSVRSVSSVKSIEEWTDLDVPATGLILKTPIQRSPALAELPTNIEDDEISGLEIPSSGLTLRPRAPSSAEDVDLAHDEEDDENWDDVSIPDEVVEKLKTLPGTLVTQPIIKQTVS